MTATYRIKGGNINLNGSRPREMTTIVMLQGENENRDGNETHLKI